MNQFHRVGSLLRLALRRDRYLMPAWVLALGSLTSIYYVQFEKLYPTEAARQVLVATTKANPAWVAISGPLSANSVGALALWKSSITIVVLAVATALTVIRHGRADEELGRRELLESTPIGRLAHPAAAIEMGVIAAVGTGLVESLTLIAVKAPAGSAVLAGSALALTGVVFALIAGLVGELTESARTARLFAGASIAVAFVLRAAGDVGAIDGRGWLSWLSPLGWANGVQAFGADRWWVLLLPTVLTMALVPVVIVLDRSRDIGSGAVQPRPGRATARGRFRSPLALAWRLQRTTLYAWALLFAVMGYVVGSSAKSLADTLKSSPQLLEWLQRLGGVGAVTDLYDAVVISIMGMFAAAYAVQAVLRLHSEEESGRAEPIVAAAVSRIRWASSHLVVACGGSALLMVVLGLSAGAGQATASNTGAHALTSLVGACLAQLPAVWLLAGVTLLLFGVAPRWSMAAWVVYGLVFVVGVVVPAAWPGSRLVDLSPFTHIPKLPGATISWPPLVWLSVSVAASIAIGLVALRRRDLR